MKENLWVVWLSCDKEAASGMALLYLRDCAVKCWFRENNLILWGPTVELVAKNQDAGEEIKLLQSVGVNVVACVSCASLYGVVDKLKAMGIPCLPMGEKLTEILKNNEAVIFV